MLHSLRSFTLATMAATILPNRAQAHAGLMDSAPLAVVGIMGGWARWLELRLNLRENPVAWQVSGWIWPACLLFCGLLLLGYHEA